MRAAAIFSMIGLLLTGAAVSAAGPVDGRTIQLAQASVKPAASDKWYVAEPLAIDLDVDTAYVRIKREFGFNTLEERLANTPGVRGNAQELYIAGFAFDGQSGAYYLMRDRVLPPQRILQVEVMKNGTGSLVEYAFATALLDDVRRYDMDLRTRLLDTLK